MPVKAYQALCPPETWVGASLWSLLLSYATVMVTEDELLEEEEEPWVVMVTEDELLEEEEEELWVVMVTEDELLEEEEDKPWVVMVT